MPILNASDFVAAGQQILPIEIDPAAPPNSVPDPFRSDVSLKAICIAPDSDVDTLQVLYPDPARPGALTQTVVGVGAPFVGQINALNGAPNTGKILFTTTRTFLGTASFWAGTPGFPTPKLKAFGYFSEPPFLPVTRADYFIQTGGTGTGAGEKSFYRRPYYGRRILHVNMTALSINAGNVTIKVYGWNLSAPQHATLLNTTVLAPSAEGDFVMTNKFFDAIELTITAALNDGVGVDVTSADYL